MGYCHGPSGRKGQAVESRRPRWMGACREGENPVIDKVCRTERYYRLWRWIRLIRSVAGFDIML